MKNEFFWKKSNERKWKKKPSAVKLSDRCLLQNKNIILRKAEIGYRRKALKMRLEKKLLTNDFREIRTRSKLHSWQWKFPLIFLIHKVFHREKNGIKISPSATAV